MAGNTIQANAEYKAPVKSYAVYTAIALLGSCIIGLMIHSTFNSIRVVEKYLPLVDAAMEIKLEATSAHLWLEELLSGDQNEVIETVWRHQDQARWYANAMLKGGVNQEGIFQPLEAPEMRRKITAVLLLLDDFRKITQIRYETSKTSGSGTLIDQQYDSLFMKFINQSDDVEATLQQLIRNEMVRYKFTQVVLIIIILLFLAGICLAFRRFDIYRSNRLDESHQKNVALNQEVIERRRAQKSLKESEQRYTRLVNSAKDVIFRKSLWDGDIEFINPAAKAVFGYAPEEFYHRPKLLDELVHPDWQLLFNEKLAGIVHGQPSEPYEYQIIDRSGNVKWVLQKNVTVCDDTGRPMAIEAFVADVTEMKTVEEERLALERHLQQARKLESLGILAGGIAHDFNNLLMIILGNADIALRDLAPASPIRNHLKNIATAVNRAARVVKQMRAYSGEGRFVSNTINLNEFIDELAHMLEVVISKKTFLNFQFTENMPRMKGDDTQLRQMILNLVTNADEAIGDGYGEIILSTGTRFCDRNFLEAVHREAFTGLSESLPDGDYVFFAVKDTGGGMGLDVRRKLFDPFFTTKFTGRGLGMAEVQGIVRSHQGAIKVDSVLGRGTTVQILFPVFEQVGSAQKPEVDLTVTEPPGAKRAILVVDDEDDVLTICKIMLERAGFRVMTAPGGEEALGLLKSHMGEIDCVLLDLSMPRLSGEEVFCQMRVIQPDIKVILSSGYNEYDVTRHLACEGLAGFIQKPYSSKKLLSVLLRVLAAGK